MVRDDSRLRAVKLIHTVAWAFFASCIVLIPFVAWQHRFALAGILIGTVAIVTLVLVANAWRCPLTDVAARYTDDRRPNFDIYLPRWLARYNKEIFGSLYVVGIVWTLVAWLGSRATERGLVPVAPQAHRVPAEGARLSPCRLPGIAESLQCAAIHVPEVRGEVRGKAATRTIGLQASSARCIASSPMIRGWNS